MMNVRKLHTTVIRNLLLTLKANESVDYWQELNRQSEINLPLDCNSTDKSKSIKNIFHHAMKSPELCGKITWPKCGKQSHFKENLRKDTPSVGYVCRTI